MAEWHTVESARDQWVDAPTDDGEDEDASLTELLEAAKAAVLAYAPSLGELTIVDGVITYGQPVVDEDGYIVNGTLESIPTTYRSRLSSRPRHRGAALSRQCLTIPTIHTTSQ
jgi:hypothetical protein